MAVTIDTQNSGFISESGTTVSATLTVANQANRVLVALIGNSTSRTVSGVAYTAGSGGSWAQLGSILNGGAGIEYEIWSSVAPSTGSVTVQATLSATINAGADAVIQVYSLYNVDQVTPVDGYASASNTNTLNVTSDATAMALCSHVSSGDPDPLSGGGTGDLSNVNNQFWKAAHFQTGPTATFSWVAASPKLINGCNVRAVAVIGGVPSRARTIFVMP